MRESRTTRENLCWACRTLPSAHFNSGASAVMTETHPLALIFSFQRGQSHHVGLPRLHRWHQVIQVLQRSLPGKQRSCIRKRAPARSLHHITDSKKRSRLQPFSLGKSLIVSNVSLVSGTCYSRKVAVWDGRVVRAKCAIRCRHFPSPPPSTPTHTHTTHTPPTHLSHIHHTLFPTTHSLHTILSNATLFSELTRVRWENGQVSLTSLKTRNASVQECNCVESVYN